MATAWLTASEMRAWRNFIESVGTLTAALESDLVQFGLTMGDYEVLVRLSESEDQQLRMCDLSTALQLSPSGLTRRLDGLVKTGLVERIASPSDRRDSPRILVSRRRGRRRSSGSPACPSRT